MACKHTHTQSAPAFTECKHATTTQTNNSGMHHKAQICTSGCTRSCVLALIKSHRKMRAHTYSGTKNSKHQHIKPCYIILQLFIHYLIYVRQFHDVNSHSAGCLLHYEGRDPADRPIPCMQQFYLHSVFSTQRGDPQPVTIKSRTGQTKLIKQWHV